MAEIKQWDLERLTNGEYAALRRAAGTTDFDAMAWRAFYQAVRDAEDYPKEQYFALCMNCLWRRTDEVTVLPMEQCLQYIVWDREDGKPKLRQGMAKRVDALLETNYNRDNYFLGKVLSLVKIIRSDERNFKPDFEKLAADFRGWNCPNRNVQRRWLRTIYHNINENDNTKEEN